MASYAQTYTMPEHESGDTFSGVEFTLTVNDVVKDLTSATITMTIAGAGTLLTGSGITITDATNGVFEIDEQVISYTPHTYDYEITFIFSDGSVKTYIEGTWKITR